MPTVGTLVVFAAAALALVVIPGPNHLFIATRSLAQGPRAGLASGLGVELGTLVHTVAAAIGLSALIASSALAFDVVRYAGAAYLVVLGLRALRDRRGLDLLDAADEARAPLRRTVAEGALVNILNPKVALFFLAFLPQFVDPARGSTATQLLALGAVLSLIGMTANVVWAFAAGALRARLTAHEAFRTRQRYVTGGVYLALGAAAAVAGGRRPA
jgi:threonine/homoserine/homoserine lactone efflux protein